MVQKYPGMRSYLPTTTVPLTAFAEARLGKIADAEAHIAATPADCYDCHIARARIAELQGQHPRADWWFARAIYGKKSIPMAYSYWGEALMERGDLDGAIAKFTLANQKGPHFADPLEMWGEALMKANLPRMALYSLRHRGTTALRATKVPKEQIDYQLGHVQQGARTTQDYGQYEPGYLTEATLALDTWISRVLKLSRKVSAKSRKAGRIPTEILQRASAALRNSRKSLKRLVGERGFEPPAPTSRT